MLTVSTLKTLENKVPQFAQSIVTPLTIKHTECLLIQMFPEHKPGSSNGYKSSSVTSQAIHWFLIWPALATSH